MANNKKRRIDYAELQAAADEMELVSREFEEVIPDAEIARFVGSDLRRTLESIVDAGPVLGGEAAWNSWCDRYINDHPLQFLITGMVLGTDRGLRYVSDGSQAANRRLATAWTAMLPLGRQGVVWGRAIEETLKANPDLATTIAAFEVSWLAASGAKRIADGLRHVVNHDYDMAVVILALQVENMLREWAKFYGADVRAKAPRTLMLGDLLGLAKPRLPSAWWLQLYVVVGDPILYNLRNDAAHGSQRNFGLIDLALILQVLTYLAAIPDPTK